MKKANLLTCFVVAFGFARYAAAQEQSRESAVEEAAQEYRQQEEALANRQGALRAKLGGGPSADGEQARNELRLLVKQSFDARQKLRSAQVKELQRRLHDIELAIGKSQANEETIIDARVDDLLSGRPTSGRYVTVYEQYVEDGEVKTRESRVLSGVGTVGRGAVQYVPQPLPSLPSPRVVPSGNAPTMTPPVTAGGSGWKNGPPGVMAGSETGPADANFDIDTRERLAELDLEQASAKRDVAANDYESHKEANQKAPGSTPQPEMRKLEDLLRLAEIEVKRARTKLEGFARERSDLAAAAEVEVEAAEAARHKAVAKLETSRALAEAAASEIAKAEADVTSAQANFDFCQKQYDRMKELAEAKSVEERLVDEKSNELQNAKGALESVRTGVVIAKAEATQAKSAAAESQADVELAEARLRAAQARRDRLAGATKTKQQAPQDRVPELREERE